MVEEQQQAKKKRVADRQINKDQDGDGGSDEDDHQTEAQGTWQRASEEEIKKRRIVR